MVRRFAARAATLIAFSALVSAATGCAGGLFESATPPCSDPDDPSTCSVSTDPPPGSMSTAAPTPVGCVDRALVLYPVTAQPAGFSGQIYLTLPQNEAAGSFLAIQLVIFAGGGGNRTVQDPGALRPVLGTVPSYVYLPPAQGGWAGTFTSSGTVQIPPTASVHVFVVDTRTPALCPPVDAGGFTTILQSNQRPR